MTITIREPGSAITHLIGLLLAAFAAIPMLVKAALFPPVRLLQRWPSL